MKGYAFTVIQVIILIELFSTKASGQWIGVWNKEFICKGVYSSDSERWVIQQLKSESNKREINDWFLCVNPNRDTLLSYNSRLRELFLGGKLKSVRYPMALLFDYVADGKSSYTPEYLPNGKWFNYSYSHKRDTFSWKWCKEIEQGKISGVVKEYDPYENGYETIEVSNGMYNGFDNKWTSNNLMSLCYYRNNLLIEVRSYYGSGMLEMKKNRGGTEERYYRNGQRFLTAEIDSLMQYHGKIVEWDSLGRKIDEGQLLYGRKEGVWYLYRQDGSIAKEEKWEYNILMGEKKY